MQLQINAKRLMKNLMDIAEIGGTLKGGCNRQALTNLDEEGRALFASWCSEFGFELTFDAVGNMFARLNGRDNSLAPLVLGSHLDTQPTGGKYDGVLGVLAGLEVMRTLVENNIELERSVEVVCWMNEEGARFAPAMMGSGVFSGMLDLDAVRSAEDVDGITVGHELDRHGYSKFPCPTDKNIHRYLELHIEQGPVLESEGKTIGVVSGAQGIRWYDITISGQEVHAGPFPMALRNDPVSALSLLLAGVFDIGQLDDRARSTIGVIKTVPASRNVVPARVEFTVDLRHPDEDSLTQMHQRLENLVSQAQSKQPNLKFNLHSVWHSPAVEFDPNLVSCVRQAARKLNYSHMELVSGAGHDALMVSRRAPTAMIFIPCRDGLSHNEAEFAEPADIEAGANVLLSATCEALGLA